MQPKSRHSKRQQMCCQLFVLTVRSVIPAGKLHVTQIVETCRARAVTWYHVAIASSSSVIALWQAAIAVCQGDELVAIPELVAYIRQSIIVGEGPF